MSFDQIIKRGLEIREKYSLLQKKQCNRTWTAAEHMAGFVGDVGDLMKLVMAKKGIRKIDDVDRKLAHELSDCLWSIIVLAEHFKVDLEKEFYKTMDELEVRIGKELG